MLNWRDPKNPKSGGAERVSSAFLHGLVERGHEVFWFANNFPGAKPFEIMDGMTIVRGGGYGSSILEARKWHRTQPKFDLVIDQHHGIPWYAPWWSGTNTLAYIHEVLGPIWRSFYKWPVSWVGEAQERWTHWLYRKIPFWVPSHSTALELRRRGVKSVGVIPNGTDATPLSELPDKHLAAPLRLITVSRLAPNKRVDHAIRVLQALQNLKCPANLSIVGDGESRSTLEALVADAGLQAIVRFTGALPEEKKDEELSKAHLLIHTSVREGWGLNVLEANALGTPAVVYPVGGLVDSTLKGVTGIVTESEDPLNMAAHLGRLVKDPQQYARLRVSGWERSKRFCWNRILPKSSDWLEAYARGERPSSPFPEGY
jgi:glycosyltransferase involved in cell wall biosynthesis